MSKVCKIILVDEVNCACVGLSRDHYAYFYEKYGIHTENYFFSPKYQLGAWDGKIRYFHKTGKTYITLLDEIVPMIANLGYDIELQDKRKSLPVTPPPIGEDFFSHIVNADGEPGTDADQSIDSGPEECDRSDVDSPLCPANPGRPTAGSPGSQQDETP